MFSVDRNSFISTSTLFTSLVNDLLANGFNLKYPATLTGTQLTLEAGDTVDPLAAVQPWRLHLKCDTNTLMILVGTPLQLPDDGSVALEDNGISQCGFLGSYEIAGTTSKVNSFIDRSLYTGTQALAYPMSYKLTVAPHGLAICIFEQAMSTNSGSWVVIQRPVNNLTGATRTTGKAPVHCLFGIFRPTVSVDPNTVLTDSNTYKLIKRFVVRESDVLRPTTPVDATIDSDDCNRIINSKQQVAITEDLNWVVTFPHAPNTQRYAYPNDELDLIGYTSADVVSLSSQFSLPMYGEPVQRSYKALCANGIQNTNMRIVMLQGGGKFV